MTDPTVLTQAQAGLPPLPEMVVPHWKETRGAVVHFAGVKTRFSNDLEKNLARYRSFAQYHMNHNGWRYLGYNFGICRDGTVVTGRGFDAVPGAHATKSKVNAALKAGTGPFAGMSRAETLLTTRRANFIWPFAINVLVGVGNKATDAQVASLVWLLRKCEDHARLNGARLFEVWGHRNLSMTVCPGRRLTAVVTRIQQGRAGGLVLPDSLESARGRPWSIVPGPSNVTGSSQAGQGTPNTPVPVDTGTGTPETPPDTHTVDPGGPGATPETPTDLPEWVYEGRVPRWAVDDSLVVEVDDDARAVLWSRRMRTMSTPAGVVQVSKDDVRWAYAWRRANENLRFGNRAGGNRPVLAELL